MSAIGLKSQIWNNNLRSMLLLTLYPFLLLGLLWMIAAALAAFTAGGTSRVGLDPIVYASAMVEEWWLPVLAAVLVWFGVSWLYHTKMIRMMAHAHPVTRLEEPELYNMLENLCIARGMKMPKLEIVETHARNAFASGVGDDSYTVTVTRGLLNTLKPDEVEAVLGHELTHIVNRDVRLLMVCVIFTGMIGFCAQVLFTFARHSMHISSRRGNAGLILIVISAILWLGYFASSLTRFAVSRRREYMADAGSVELTRNPEAMIRALMRISGRDQIPEAPDDVAIMCIENTRPFLGIFATHPPIEARIQALAGVAGIQIPEIAPRVAAGTGERFQRPGDKKIDWITLSRQNRNPWT